LFDAHFSWREPESQNSSQCQAKLNKVANKPVTTSKKEFMALLPRKTGSAGVMTAQHRHFQENANEIVLRSQAQWHTQIVPAALRKLGQEELKFKASLSYIASSRPAWVT
jgi:hypothetical protein